MVAEIKNLKRGVDLVMADTVDAIQKIEAKQQKRKSSLNFFVTVVPQFDGTSTPMYDSGSALNSSAVPEPKSALTLDQFKRQ